MKQRDPIPPNRERGKSGNASRVATRDLVKIGQRWERRGRQRTGRLTVQIRQIHRADRQVEADVLGVGLEPSGRLPMIRITFPDLRNKYRLLDHDSKEGKHGNVVN